MIEDILREARERMEARVENFRRELATVRAGRATPALLEKIRVDYYGTPTPLQQLATITAPEPRMLVVQPWDKSVMGEIEKAIAKSDLGVNPSSDGQVIRIVLPPLTEETRNELVKRVRDEVGAVAALREVDIVAGLPKTRSGKILRRTMREIADGKEPTVPATIEDASVLDRLTSVLRPRG